MENTFKNIDRHIAHAAEAIYNFENEGTPEYATGYYWAKEAFKQVKQVLQSEMKTSENKNGLVRLITASGAKEKAEAITALTNAKGLVIRCQNELNGGIYAELSEIIKSIDTVRGLIIEAKETPQNLLK